MKNLKNFNEFTNESIKDWFYKPAPKGKKPRSIGKQLVDGITDFFTIKNENLKPIKYGKSLKKLLTNLKNRSKIAEALLEVENNNNFVYTFTNAEVNDNDNTTITILNNDTNKRESIKIIQFTKEVLKHRKFTERSYELFINKFNKEYRWFTPDSSIYDIDDLDDAFRVDENE